MAEDSKEDIFVFRDQTEYDENSEAVQLNYSDYKLVDIRSELIPTEDLALHTLADYIEISDLYLGLEGKTQILNAGVDNPEKGITTRMIHDMQVAQNAMKIANVLKGNIRDVLIARIAGLGHDIGHTPFGHDGEVALSEAINDVIPEAFFSHSEYSGQIVDTMIGSIIESAKENENSGFGVEDSEVLSEVREEIVRAVKNHSQYFQYKLEGETIGEKSVRLSDTLTFMVTDLFDLMRGEDAKSPGQKILPKEELKEKIREKFKELSI